MASAASRILQNDIGRVFMQPKVQALLKTLTGLDIGRVYRTRRSRAPKALTYRLMTDAQVEEARQLALSRAAKKLQLPPVLAPRTPCTRVLARDTDIAGLDTSKLIFTDISLNVSGRNREIVVREPDGTLRVASWEERDKLNQIYFPVAGRKIDAPKMFSDENLRAILQSKSCAYEYILDRACLQFEPDDPAYLKVVHATYDHCDANAAYDELKSTRHFGGLVFYLACSKRIDGLLVDSIGRDRLADAVNLVHLFCLVWSTSDVANTLRDASGTTEDEHSQGLSSVKAFLSTDSTRRPQLELAVQAYADRHRDDASAVGSVATTTVPPATGTIVAMEEGAAVFPAAT